MEILVILIIGWAIFGGKSKPKRRPGKVSYRHSSPRGARYRGGRRRW